MGKSESKGPGLWTFFKIIFLLILIGGLVLVGMVFYRGIQSYQKGTAPPVILNQTIVNNETNIIKQGPEWPFYVTAVLLMLAVGIIIYLILRNRTKFGRRVDIRKPTEQAFRMLLEMNYPFFYLYNGQYHLLKHKQVDKKRYYNAMGHILPGSGIIYFKRDVRFMRVLLRFWAYPRPIEQATPDEEPPMHQIYTVSVDPDFCYYEPQFLGPMTRTQLDEYIHKQEYGFIAAPVPAAAENIIDARVQEKLQEGAQELFKNLGKEAVSE